MDSCWPPFVQHTPWLQWKKCFTRHPVSSRSSRWQAMSSQMVKRDPIYRWTGVFRIGKSGEPLTNMIQYSVGCSMSMSIFILYCLYWFGTCLFSVSIILGIIIQTDFHIFQRGSNQQPVFYVQSFSTEWPTPQPIWIEHLWKTMANSGLSRPYKNAMTSATNSENK